MYEDIFKFKIPQHKPRIEKIMDLVISNKDGFEVNDPVFLRKFSRYIRPLKRHDLIGFYHDSNFSETIIKIRNTNDVLKNYDSNGTIEYSFFIKPKKLDIL